MANNEFNVNYAEFDSTKMSISLEESSEDLSDEELAMISGGFNIDPDLIRAGKEAAGSIWRGSQDLGRTIGKTFWNNDRHSDQCTR